MANVSPRIVKWAFYGVKHHLNFTYSEGSDRMSSIGTKPGKLPVICDCSAFVTLCYFWAGCKDPNGGTAYVRLPKGWHWGRAGYTGTLLAHDEHIALFRKNPKEVRVEEVLPGDLVVYGGGTGEHVALVISQGNGDPITISMGKQGDPSIVRVSQDGRLPQTYLRCDTSGPGIVKRVLNFLPRPPKAVVSPAHPSVAQSPTISARTLTEATETSRPPSAA